MTIAICIRCGAQKIGALTLCGGCGYDPTTDTDRRNQARALWLSDRHNTPQALASLGAQLKAGQPVAWDDAVINELVVQLQTQQNALLIGKTPIGCSVFVWSLIAVMIGLGGLLIFLFLPRD